MVIYKGVEYQGGADLLAKAVTEADEGRKQAIEERVRECDGIAKKIHAARQTLERPEVVDFDVMKKTTEEIRTHKADLEARKSGIFFDLQRVDDNDFKDLVGFHLQRLDK